MHADARLNVQGVVPTKKYFASCNKKLCFV